MDFIAKNWMLIISAFLACQCIGNIAYNHIKDKTFMHKHLPEKKTFRFLILEFLALGGWILIPLFYVLAAIFDLIFLRAYEIIFNDYLWRYRV